MSEIKLNNEFIREHKINYSEILISVAYNNKLYLNNEDILKISSIKQLNLLILKQLFNKWKNEVLNIKSPYFNYENEEVKSKINELLQTLSFNIKIAAKDLKPLIQNAIEETFIIYLNPVAYLKREFNQNNNDILDETTSKNVLKYIVVYKENFKSLFSQFVNLPKDQMLSNAPKFFNEDMLYTEGNSLSSLFGIHYNTFFMNIIEEEEDIEEFENDEEDKQNHISDEEEIIEKQNEEEEEEDVDIEEEQDEEENLIQNQNEDNEEEQDDDESLFEKENILIQETKQVEHNKSISEKFEQNVINSNSSKGTQLFDLMTLNQKRNYQMILFNNEEDAFKMIEKDINNFKTFDDFVHYLFHQYAKKYNWDIQSKVLKDFLKVIFRVFK